MNNTKPTVKKLSKTCDACPSQWEGETTDGRVVYIRYRWGYLSAGIGADIGEAVRDNLYEEQIGGELDGYIMEYDMKAFLVDVFDFEED